MLSENEAADNAETTETTSTKTIAEVVEPVDITTISVDTLREYKLRTLVDSFPKSWGSKAGKVLADKLKTKKGIYIWMKKTDIPSQVDPLEWFVANLKETDPKKGSLIKAYYIGSGDVVARGWSTPAGKHPFGDWLKSEDNVENLIRSDFQFFFLSIKEQGEYESLESALQEWNKIHRADKLPFEIGETSASGGRLGDRLRKGLRFLSVMDLEELAAMQEGLLDRTNEIWVRDEYKNVLARSKS